MATKVSGTKKPVPKFTAARLLVMLAEALKAEGLKEQATALAAWQQAGVSLNRVSVALTAAVSRRETATKIGRDAADRLGRALGTDPAPYALPEPADIVSDLALAQAGIEAVRKAFEAYADDGDVQHFVDVADKMGW